MSFLYPAFFLGALAIAIPIILHLLRRDVAPDVPFTAVRLLRRSPIERSRRRRLRDLLLLAARVAALVLLAAAFARPYIAKGTGSGALRIVAIDRSFSMAAPGRFEKALETASAAIDEAGFTERIALIAFDERAEIIALPGSAADARAALKGVTPGHAATRYGSVIEAAREIASGGPARLVIVTDLQRAGWDGESRAAAPESLAIDVRTIGGHATNVAVTEVRSDFDVLVASLKNFSSSPRRGSLTFLHDGAAIGRVPFDARAGITIEVQLRWKAPPAGTISASVDDSNGFPSDNSRHTVLKGAGAPTAMVVHSGDASGFFLVKALEAVGGPIEPRPVTGAEIAAGRARGIAGQAAVILLTTRNLDRAARDGIVTFVRQGGGLLVAAAPEVEPDVVAAMFGWDASGFVPDVAPRQLTIAAADVRHPVMRPFRGLTANLGQIAFTRSWRVKQNDWDVPARFSDGSPALLDRGVGSGRVMLFASDVDRRWNDFPLHASFVPFVVESVRYLAMRRAQPAEYLVSRVPAGIAPVPGIHKLADGRVVAVNADARESSTAVMSVDEFKGKIDRLPPAAAATSGTVKAEQTEARQNLWQYGLVLMLLALVAESFVGKV